MSYDFSGVEGVAKTEFIKNDGNVVAGAFETVNDNWVLCKRWTFETLVSKAGVPIEMTLDEADGKYGDEIIKRHQSGVVQEMSIDEIEEKYGAEIIRRHEERLANEKQAIRDEKIKARQEASKRTKNQMHERLQAEVLREILRGSTKADVTYKLGYSFVTVHNALKDMTPETATELFNKYDGTIFSPEERGALVTYTKMAKCNYREFRTIYKRDEEAKMFKKLDESISINNDANKYMDDIKTKSQVALGGSPFVPSIKSNCSYDNEDAVASTEAIKALFRGSSHSTPNSSVTQKEQEDITPYIEKMNELQKKSNEHDRLFSQQKSVYAETDEWGEY